MLFLLLVALLLAAPSWAADNPLLRQSDGTDIRQGGVGDRAKTSASLETLLACERIPELLCVVEERYVTIPTGDTDANFTADKLVKSGPGYVKDLVCSSAAAATAGTIQVRDSAVAGAGSVLGTIGIAAQAYPTPLVLPLSTPFSVGLFIDYTTTTISCYARYR